MDILKLTDQELIQELVNLARKEREALGLLIRLLREVERRKFYLDLGFSSLYVFCVEKLGFSEHESHLRIQATRLTYNLPEVETALEQGKLSLSVAARAQSHFRRVEKQNQPVPVEIQREIIDSLLGLSTREAERRLADQFPGEPPRERIQFLADRKVRVEIVLDLENWERLDELRSIRSHVNPAKRLDVMLLDLIALGWKKWHPLAGLDRSPRARAVTPQQPGEAS